MLSKRIPELDALQVLLAVAGAGSLNAAAAGLGISQQAVSSRVRSIEAQTGLTLVRRTARGSSLTEDGVLVAEWAARLLETAAEFDAGLASLRRDRRGRLRVAASLTIAEHLLPGWLVALHAPAETVLQATNSEQVAVLVRDGQAELGFVEGPRPPSGLRTRGIGTDRLVLVVRPDHPWTRRRRALSPAELGATALVAREAGSGTREFLQQALAAHRVVTVAPALSLSTTAAIKAAVLAGAGPAVLSELAVADELATGRLVRIEVALELARTLRAVWIGGAAPPAGPARDLVALAVRAGIPMAQSRPASTQSPQ